MTSDQNALEIVRARVAADPALELAYRWVWECAATAIRRYEMLAGDRQIRNKQERARRVYMTGLAEGADPERAARMALDAVEVFTSF